jgi:hypothetical protein
MFANGNCVLMYLHALVMTPAGSLIESMAIRLIDESAQQEVGVGRTQSSNGTRVTSAVERRQARKRPRDPPEDTQSEIHVRGLEGVGAGMCSRFQAKHLDMAEARKGHAESVRSILLAIKDVKSMLADLREETDENSELERQNYIESKIDLLVQLADARKKEKERQRGCQSGEDGL